MQHILGLLGELIERHADRPVDLATLTSQSDLDKLLRFTLAIVLPLRATSLAFDPAPLADMLGNFAEGAVIGGP